MEQAATELDGNGPGSTVLRWVGRSFWRMLSWITTFLSGEFMLAFGYRFGRSNGGTMIFFRSAWITLILYAFALLLHSGSYNTSWVWGIEAKRLYKEVAETIPWLGAIFAGVYAALYARFAAQYSYLQQVYNQIMGARVSAPPGDDARECLHTWYAGFIEDAKDLHLATKKPFAVVIWFMLENPVVYSQFHRYGAGGSDQPVHDLVVLLRRAIGDEELRRMGASEALMAGGPAHDNKHGRHEAPGNQGSITGAPASHHC